MQENDWVKLAEQIPEELYSLSLAHLAQRQKIAWPTRTKYFVGLSIGDCVNKTYEDLLKIPHMGKNKINAIFQLVSYALENASLLTESHDQGLSDVANGRDDPLLISKRQWAWLCKKLKPIEDNISISYIAHDAGFKWPNKGKDHDATVRECINLSLEELFTHFTTKKAQAIIGSLASLATSQNTNALEKHSEHIAVSLDKHPCFEALKDKQAVVFEKRVLIPIEKPTLEELGEELGVTRERVRQLETEIRRHMKESSLSRTFERSAVAFAETLRSQYHQGRMHFLDSDVQSIAEDMSREVVLHIFLRKQSVDKWLSSLFIRNGKGWFLGSRKEFAEGVSVYRNFKNLPAHLDLLKQSFSERSVMLGISIGILQGQCELKGNYLLAKGSGYTRARRAIYLHARLLEKMVYFSTKQEAMNLLLPQADRRQFRLFRIALDCTPTLFAATPSYFVPLQCFKSPLSLPELPAFDIKQDEDSSFVSEGTYETLIKIAMEIWPFTSTELAQAAKDNQATEHLAETSIIPMVLQETELIRLSPGLFGVRDFKKFPKKLKKARSKAMNILNVRAYTFVRRSLDAASDLFPLWDFEQEMRWHRKLSDVMGEELCDAFHSIVSPSDWPEQVDLEQFELRERKLYCHFRLNPSWFQQRSYDVPDFIQAMVVYRYAKESGSVSWVRANHILGETQAAAEVGVNTVALGVCLGLLDSSRIDWFSQIPVSVNFDEIWTTLMRRIAKSEKISWNDHVIVDMLRAFRDRTAQEKVSFVSSATLEILIQKIQKNTHSN